MCMGYCINQNDFQEVTSAELELALANGAKLDDKGLLFIILARHHDSKLASQLTMLLLRRFSSLQTIIEMPIEDIISVKGISRAAVLDLKQIKHFLNAVSRASVTNLPVLDCYEQLIDFCKFQFGATKKEQFHSLFLNKRYELVHHECLQTGTLDHVTVYPREVLRLAIAHSASFLILAHNHPVGKAKPSRADILITKNLTSLAAGLGVGIIDHLILAGNDSFSFLQSGMMGNNDPDLLKKLCVKPIANWQ